MWKTIDKEIIILFIKKLNPWGRGEIYIFDSDNPVLIFKGKTYLTNELSTEIKESIKRLQTSEIKLKMHEDTMKLITLSRNSLEKQLREKLKKPRVKF